MKYVASAIALVFVLGGFIAHSEEMPVVASYTIDVSYLERRRTGLDRRGNQLPAEKPLLMLTADEISDYKDRFVLNDRALLFFDWMRTRMGTARFNQFTRELFSLESLDSDRLVSIIEAHLPDSRDDTALWLRKTEFPERFRTAHVTAE